MQSKVEGFLRAINNNGKYNILTYPIHERTQANWKSMPHTFYLYCGEGIKFWNNKYAQLPENHILLDGSQGQIKPDMKFDLVLNQNKAHFPISQKIAASFNIPLITLEHTLPYPEWTQKYIDYTKKLRGNINLYITEYNAKKWGMSLDDPSVQILHHGIDTEIFKPIDIPKEKRAFACSNDLKNRGWACGYNEWKSLVDGFPNKILGDNPGLSESAKSVEHLVEEYNKSICFVSTTLVSPIPTVVLEAMSCGLPVLVLDNCALPEVVQDGYSGYISNDIQYLRNKLSYLLENPSIAKEMGKNARQTILEKFSLEKHLNKLMMVFNSVIGKGYNL